ncbi:hypothetical protein B0T18DRAFT_414275 [Schizothecium vesticola]|uniref:Uncharacterized protein n=1 Tax=Schizothecium vesticola TaxID=314040 RepID=A0AA40EPC4_9PEZI|nr:hypothetical protein B0T18DRAFT_414275 [Schizothecium vesticola]
MRSSQEGKQIYNMEAGDRRRENTPLPLQRFFQQIDPGLAFLSGTCPTRARTVFCKFPSGA